MMRNNDKKGQGGYGKAFVQKFSAILGLLLLCVALSLLTDKFLTVSNIRNILSQVSVVAVIAAGSTFVILTGGIDLSVGSMLGLSSIFAAGLFRSTGNEYAAMAACVIVGTVLGLINGVLVAYVKLPSFVATLGMMSIARGICFVYTQGRPISSFPLAFRYLGTALVGPIPVLVMVTIVVYLVSWYVLKKTPYGRYVHAIGSNETATRLSGIRTNFCKCMAYVICGALCGFAALLFTGRINSAHPQSGLGYEMNAIAAVVIGGTSLAGGKGGVDGTIIGALIMGVIANGLNLLDVDTYWQQVVLGAIIIVAVAIDIHTKKQQA